jgi:hypothetical protein
MSGFLALGRLPQGTMNKTEQAYERDLRDAQTLGDILWYRFEGLKLRLSRQHVLHARLCGAGRRWRDRVPRGQGLLARRCRAKIKVAAEQYPFRFKAVRVRTRKEGGGWAVEAF